MAADSTMYFCYERTNESLRFKPCDVATDETISALSCRSSWPPRDIIMVQQMLWLNLVIISWFFAASMEKDAFGWLALVDITRETVS